MAFPIFAKLSFTAPGVQANIAKIGRQFGRLRNDARKLSASVGKVGQGMKSIGLASLGATAGVAIATKTFAGFEKQMSVVKSLTGEISKETFAEMSSEAKRLGATTSFSAKQAAEGLQFLALAGFSAHEQIGSLEGVLNLAAAGSLELGAASDIATDSLSALTPAFKDPAAKVKNLTSLVDKFALVQSKTNTNVAQLGEAVKFGGGTLAGFGVNLNEIIASLGALADSGLKGSIGGTAVTNMFNKLLKPSSNAKKIMKELGIVMVDAAGAILPIPDLMDNLVGGLDKIKGPARKSQAAIELFGVRGIRAFNALKNKGSANMRILIEQIENASEGIGSAAKQANARLDNLSGAFTKLKSATEGVLIEIGALFAKFFRKPIEDAANIISGFAQAFQVANGQIKATSKTGQLFFKQFGPERAKQMVSFVKGFISGFEQARDVIKGVFVTVAGFMQRFRKSSGLSAKEIGSLVAKILTFGAIAGPIILGAAAALFILGPIVAGIGAAFSGIVTVVQILGTVLGLIFSPAGAIIAGIAILGFALFNIMGGFEGIKAAITTFGQGFMETFGPVIQTLKDDLLPVIGFIKETWGEAFGAISTQMDGSKNDFSSFGSVIATVVKGILFVITPLVKFIGILVGGLGIIASSGIGALQKVGSFLGFGGTPIVPTPGLNRVSPEAVPTGNAAGKISLAPNQRGGLGKDIQSANAAATQRVGILSPVPQTIVQDIGSEGSAAKAISANITIQMDGEVVARQQANLQLETDERLGVETSPGERALALRGKTSLTRGKVK